MKKKKKGSGAAADLARAVKRKVMSGLSPSSSSWRPENIAEEGSGEGDEDGEGEEDGIGGEFYKANISLAAAGGGWRTEEKREEDLRYFLSSGSKLQLQSSLGDEMREVRRRPEEEEDKEMERAARRERFQRNPSAAGASRSGLGRVRGGGLSAAAAEGGGGGVVDRAEILRKISSSSSTSSLGGRGRRPASAASMASSASSSTNPNWILLPAASWHGSDEDEDDHGEGGAGDGGGGGGGRLSETSSPWKNKRALRDSR